jgi:trehalose 6-phosphate phosphatase
LHYRHARQPERAAAAARSCAAHFQARVIEGKRVVEVLLSDADKGTAINHLRQALGTSVVVFFGDDTTDEDVFAAMQLDDVPVKVGPERSLARYRVADPTEVAQALTALLAARQAIS